MPISADMKNAPLEGADAHFRVEGLQVGYGKTEIVHGVSMTVNRGDIAVIVGPNGAGKSTFIKGCMRLVTVFGGQVHLEGKALGDQSTEDLVRAGIGYVPQLNRVFPRLTIAENLELGGYRFRRQGRKGRKQFKEILESVVESVPQLQGRMNQRAGTLSGGEQTMLAVARGMMGQPSVLLLDEPSTALSPGASNMLWDYLERLKGTKVSIVIVEQRAREALAHADRGYVLIGGTIALQGTGEELLQLDLGALFLGAHRDEVSTIGAIRPTPDQKGQLSLETQVGKVGILGKFNRRRIS